MPVNTAPRQGFTTVLLQGVVLLLLVVVVAPPPVEAITFTDAGFFSEPVATLAPFKPVGVTFAPDGRIFIWQRDGVIRIVKNGALLPTPFLNFSSKVNTYTDHGFLGVALDPNFAANGWVYVFYTYEAGGNPNDTTPKTGHLSRVTADPTNPDVMLANSEVILLGTLDVPPCSQYPVGADCFPTDSYTHSVGSLRFLPDGTLFASHGDGATADFADVLALRAQSLDSYAGKLLRIKPDGSAPQAPLTVNPFNDGSNSIRSKVWAYGLRNPFRFGVHPTTHLPFIGDVGWNTWEEINQGAPGANYGWPCWEGNAQQPGYQASFPTQCQSVTAGVVTSPLYTYDRTVGSTVIGGAFFTGAQYPAAYAGNFFLADYTAGWMKRLVFDGSGNLQSVVDFASNIGNDQWGARGDRIGPGRVAVLRGVHDGGSRPHSAHEWQRVEFPAVCRRRGLAPQRLFAAPGRLLQRRLLRPGRGRADLSVGVWGWRHLHGAESVSYLYHRGRHDVSGALDRDGPARREIHGHPECRGGQHAPGRHHRPAGQRSPIYGGPDGHLSRVGHRPR